MAVREQEESRPLEDSSQSPVLHVVVGPTRVGVRWEEGRLPVFPPAHSRRITTQPPETGDPRGPFWSIVNEGRDPGPWGGLTGQRPGDSGQALSRPPREAWISILFLPQRARLTPDRGWEEGALAREGTSAKLLDSQLTLT